MTTRRVFLGGALAAASALTLPAWRVAGDPTAFIAGQ